MNNNPTTLKNSLIKLLENLNNGDKFTLNDIELNYKQIKPFIERLKTIDAFPFDRNFDDIYYFEKNVRKTFDKYHVEDIAETILQYRTNQNHIKDIQYTIQESKLPRRDDKKYQIISSYEPYELTHCISYEMAIRNEEVIALLKNIKFLSIANKQLFKASILPNDIEIQDKVKDFTKKIVVYLDTLQTSINIDFECFDLEQAQNKIMWVITELTTLLEEKYYMIYDRKEIVPEGMEDVFKEPNHYESDIELNNYMDKAIIHELYNFDDSPRYKDNFSKEDGYVVYQAVYDDAKSYDINKILPNFKRPMREFNQTQVAFNMSLPKDEIVAYIEKIKDDYDNKNTSYKTLNRLLYGDDSRIDDKLNHKQQDRYADDFFIYDYYTLSDEVHEKKLEIIQEKLSQYHGMKIEKRRNDYELINYDEAQIKMNSPKTNTNSNSFTDITKSFKEHQHIIHYLETIKTIKERYEILKNTIDNKKYKKLIHHE